jgi:uncharacterized protein (DUF362 family)
MFSGAFRLHSVASQDAADIVFIDPKGSKVEHKVSRRGFIQLTAGAAFSSGFSLAQGIPAPQSALPGSYDGRSAVSLVKGENRRRSVTEALVAIEDQIMPVLRQKKHVVIKPNNVSTVNQLAATHADALHGILDFLAPRFKGPVTIAESSAGNTLEGFENFRYAAVTGEHKSQNVSLVDLNSEGKYEVIQVLDGDLHPVPVRLAARLLDPDAYVICAAMPKTHNVTVATLSVKNMTLGAPLRSGPKDTKRWNDKRQYHGGVRQTHFDILLTAQKMRPYWGATVIDGYEGMEGNGPGAGLPVPSRLAIASTDYIAADRVGVEIMGINPDWVGCLNFCWRAGLGQYDLSKIDIRGVKPADVAKKYELHKDIELQLQWMGPLKDIPPKLG